MKYLSTGQPATLGSYYHNCNSVFGPLSESALYFGKLIKESPKGRDEEVEAEESQVMALIYSMEGVGT